MRVIGTSFKFNYWKNRPQCFRLVNCAKKTVTRMNGIQITHHISLRMGETLNVKPTTHIRRAGSRTPDLVLDDRRQTQAVGDHERRVDTEIPERPQPFTEGLTRRSSSSAHVSPTDVAIPPSAIPHSVHPPAKLSSKNADARQLRGRHATEILTIGRTESR